MEIAIALLQHYSFDLGGYTIRDLTRAWGGFKPEWVRQAVIESLFQGRYKAVSVDQILHLWERKGEPNCRYNREFERLVCGDVAVIYEDRIFYTPPRTSNRETAIAEIPPFKAIEESNPPLPFPRRSMMGTAKIDKVSPQSADPKPQKYPSRLTNPSGMTAPTKVYPSTSKAEYSEVYRSAYENMTLLAESSMFVDKLRSMCSDRLVLPAPEIASDLDKLEVPIEN
ncbi:hypothetical protein [Pseudanabaena minima]|uniref:hypothetical protein n=1 Tax=Pseudanabaena minima TaxID=890415 RepID=UPI003DA7BB5F